MRVSIEIPAFKGQFLMDAIESVLRQTSPDWELSTIWDGGDNLARAIVEEVARLGDPRIRGYIGHRRGIANARRFLTERSSSEWILPLDDDDLLAPDAVACFQNAISQRPWAGIIRARRSFIDENARPLAMAEWFPFEPRHYRHGMATDLFNHCQPYLIRRTAYDRTAGWRGFEDYHYAGEDCDIFVQIEEVAPIELYDRVLYYYRLNPQRASLDLGPAGAKEMWRRIADQAIARLGLPLRRLNSEPPFEYERTALRPLMRDGIGFVIAGPGDAEATRRSLLASGISDYAIRSTSGPAAAARNLAFRASPHEAICFIDAGATIEAGDIDRQIARFPNTWLDLSVQNCAAERGSMLLVRSEVLRATGGFDETLTHPELATIDFCLRAELRNFACLSQEEWGMRQIGRPEPPASELTFFLNRWASQEGSAPVTRVSRAGAQRSAQ
jgi:glycosyltransferase involved in cell wall biosynthesis